MKKSEEIADKPISNIGITAGLQAVALITSMRSLDIRGYLIKDWNDPQINRYLLRNTTTPLPDFYQVDNGEMKMNKFDHLSLLAEKIEYMKQEMRMVISMRKHGDCDYINRKDANFYKLRDYVNNRTNMHEYDEFRKHVRFINGNRMKTIEDVHAHLMQKYRKYCSLSPEEREKRGIDHKILWLPTKYATVGSIGFSEGIDEFKLDYNPDTIIFSIIKE
jgi:hypothetical protein